MIPILIICFNNHRYVENTIKNIERVNKDDLQRVTIVNNSSTKADTIAYLESCRFPIIHKENNGPWIHKSANTHIYNSLPNQYIITDPDLEFNKNLPSNYIEIMSNLAKQYKCGKIGFALDISDPNMYTMIYDNGEKKYWKDPIEHPIYELYRAPLDTTFCLIDKDYLPDNYFNNDIRIAGCFTSKHLPWFPSNPLFNIYDNYSMNGLQNNISSIASVIRGDIEERYNKVNIYTDDYLWVNKKFSPSFSQTNLFDKVLPFLSPDRDVIDIGGGRVDITVYMCRRARRVYVLNTDETQQTILKDNCSNVFFIKEFPPLDEISLVRFGSSMIPVIIG